MPSFKNEKIKMLMLLKFDSFTAKYIRILLKYI